MPDHPAVYVVDSDAAVRASLAAVLTSAGLAVEAYGSAAEFLAAFDAERGGCLLLDIRVPDMSAAQLRECLNERRAMVPIVFLTGHADVMLAIEAMQHGAADFVQHPCRDCEVLERVCHALERDRSNRANLRQPEAIAARIAALGATEREVLDRLAAGASEAAIARELGLGLAAVESVRARLMQTLCACSRGHLARLAAEAARAH